QTGSRYVDRIAPADFDKDKYSGMLPYITCAMQYVRFTVNRYAMASTPENLYSPRSRQLYASLNFTIDSLKQETQKRVLYYLIVNNDWSEESNDKAAFRLLFDKVRQLNLPGSYSKAIDQQQTKAFLNGTALDASLLESSILFSPDDRQHSLRSVLDAYKGKNILLDLYSANDHNEVGVSQGFAINSKYNEGYTVIHIAIDKKGPRHWIETCNAANNGDDGHFYLGSDLKNPLLSYFKVSRLPRYIEINPSIEIVNSDIPFYLMTKVALMNTTIVH
ncbi:MAG TPA: hypothetical protein VK518_15350, partial [Puia sp.]|nr:hypothetical protein [Puia sp.]